MRGPKITCREMLTFLAEYLSGALPQVQREAFDDHLSRCPECVAYVNNYQALVGLARRAAEPLPDEVPADLVRALVAARAVPRRQSLGGVFPPIS
jgi:anti-sigma factor RsiW